MDAGNAVMCVEHDTLRPHPATPKLQLFWKSPEDGLCVQEDDHDVSQRYQMLTILAVCTLTWPEWMHLRVQ